MTTEVQQEEQTQTKFFDTEFSLFGKYAYTEKVNDISVIEQTAINTSKANIIVPHTSGRYQVKRFRKAQCPIIERLTNSLMYHGRNNGKKCLAIKIVKQTMDIIALITNKNPIRVVLDAIAVAGPREDSTRIGSGGAVQSMSWCDLLFYTSMFSTASIPGCCFLRDANRASASRRFCPS